MIVPASARDRPRPLPGRTAFAFWVLHAWSTASLPWLARRKRSLILLLLGLLAVDSGAAYLVVHLHDATAGMFTRASFWS